MTYNVCSRESKDKKKIQTEGRQWADRITWRRERLRGIRLYVFTQKRKNQKRRRIAEKIQVTILGDSERVRSWATGWRFYGEVNSRALSIGFFLSFLGFCLFQELVIFIELRWGLKQTSASHLCETRKERKLKWKQWVILKACCCIYFSYVFKKGSIECDGGHEGKFRRISGKMLHDFRWLHDAKSLASILVGRSIGALTGLSPQSWL